MGPWRVVQTASGEAGMAAGGRRGTGIEKGGGVGTVPTVQHTHIAKDYTTTGSQPKHTHSNHCAAHSFKANGR